MKKAALKNSVFLKTFIILSVITFLPLICISLFFSNMAERFWRSESYISSQQSILQYANDVDLRIVSIQNECHRLSTNANVLSFILDPSFNYISRNTQIMKSLNDICELDFGVEEACLYSNFNHLILDSDGKGYHFDTYPDQAALNLYQSCIYQSSTLSSGELSSPSFCDCITVFGNVPENSADDLGCIIFNINKEKVFSLRNHSTILMTAISDGNGKYVYFNENVPAFLQTDEFKEQLAKESSPFIYKNYIILTADSSSTDWQYIGMIPMPDFLGHYQNLSFTFMGIAFAMLLFSLIMSFIAARRIYRPLKNLVSSIKFSDEESLAVTNEYQYLEHTFRSISTAMDEMRPNIKYSFFYSLIVQEPYSSEEIQNQLRFIGEDFSEYGYGLILFVIDQYEDLMKKSGEYSPELCNYQLTELIKAECSQQYPYALVRMNPSSWALVINIDPSESTHFRTLKQHFDTAANSLPFEMYVILSSLYQNISDLPYAYKETQDTLHFLRFSKTKEEKLPGQSPLYLNTKLEEELLQAIQTGSASRFEEIFRKLQEQLPDICSSLDDFKEIATHIVNRIIELMINLKIDTRNTPELASFFTDLKAAKDFDSILLLLKNTSMEAMYSICTYNISHPDKNIEKLLTYIHTHIHEDISLTSLSDVCHMSPSYISRLFKKELDIGFVEYLNRFRIQRAEQLLKETTLSVEQVGYQVGFTNIRSFLRVFKQYTNISPGQYRTEQQ